MYDRKKLNELELGNRVVKELVLENQAGKHCAVFQIKLRCAAAYRRAKFKAYV